MNQVSRQDLGHWLDTTLQAQRFRDYCPNGLQVEGKGTISHIIAGVTASEALIRAAIEKKADAILVHHGWFWKNEDPCIRGPKRTRLSLALQYELNLWAYHLPLDAHPVLGNNAQLARVLGFEPERNEEGEPLTCGPDGLVWLGRPTRAKTLGKLGDEVCNALQRTPLIVGNLQQPIDRIAWCTGGAQGFIEAASDAGAQVYITGEASEQTFHWAQETGIGFIAAGHHATERYGIQALGAAVAARFGIQVEFIDVDNPI